MGNQDGRLVLAALVEGAERDERALVGVGEHLGGEAPELLGGGTRRRAHDSASGRMRSASGPFRDEGAAFGRLDAVGNRAEIRYLRPVGA